jgi:hypothetical protein
MAVNSLSEMSSYSDNHTARCAGGNLFSGKLYAMCSFLLVFAFFTTNAAFAASWNAEIDPQSGLPALSRAGATVVASNFLFWGKDWAWAPLDRQFKVVGPYDYSLAGTDQVLNFSMRARIHKVSSREIAWEFDLDAARSTPEAIGGGIEFYLNNASFAADLGEPELLPDNRGWSWGRNDGTRVEMRFDPPLPTVYFEGGAKSKVRAFFYNGTVPQGQQHYAATLTVSNDIAIRPTIAERYGLENESSWPTDLLSWKASPVDLSFLNAAEKPAGKHGYLIAEKDKLVFKDGTPVRFWGTNLTAYALFGTSAENVKLQAHRLSELGYNLIRIHHHDSSWVSPNIFGDKTVQDTRTLNPAMLERIDWWIKCLEDEGIYVWLDLHVGRELKAADGINAFGEISKGRPSAELKGYNYANASIEQAMQSFNEALLSHRNRFTNLSYAADPGIVAYLLTNENDITNHFGNALLPDKQVPEHDKFYMAQATAFAAKFGLPRDQTWRSWEHGPSKLFLNDLEHRFDVAMIQDLRKSGTKAPIVTTSYWGGEPISSLPALTTGDIIDVHSYGGSDELSKNPLYSSSFIDWIAAAHVVDRPLSVTEWNVSPFPAADRTVIPLLVGSTASYQGWNAMMLYAYSQQPFGGPGGPSNWETFNDPALVATLPAAALLYRRGDVAEAKATYVFAPTPEQLFNHPITPDNAIALRTATALGKLLIAMPQTRELPWLEKSQIAGSAKVITDPTQSLFKTDITNAVSDTGEIRHDWDQGTLTIDTPRSQAAVGWIGGKKINLSDVALGISTRHAAVAVQSLDQKKIVESSNILISLGARSTPESGNRMPFHSEMVEGEIVIHARSGLKLYRKDNASELQEEVPVTFKNGQYLIALDKRLRTYWLYLK